MLMFSNKFKALEFNLLASTAASLLLLLLLWIALHAPEFTSYCTRKALNRLPYWILSKHKCRKRQHKLQARIKRKQFEMHFVKIMKVCSELITLHNVIEAFPLLRCALFVAKRWLLINDFLSAQLLAVLCHTPLWNSIERSAQVHDFMVDQSCN